MKMCMSQVASVRWEEEMSGTFSVTNRVKQGAVLSSILFCICIHELTKTLRRYKIGCLINGNFVDVIVYAGDIVLLSPTLDVLQEMIKTCSDYSKHHNLSFSTHTTVPGKVRQSVCLF